MLILSFQHKNLKGKISLENFPRVSVKMKFYFNLKNSFVFCLTFESLGSVHKFFLFAKKKDANGTLDRALLIYYCGWESQCV